MEKLKGSQRKHLRGLAHSFKPVVFLGKAGAVEGVVRSVNEALDGCELIKLRFVDFKEREQKEELTEVIEKATGAECVGMIGHNAIFYRQHKDPKKRKIVAK